MSAVRLYRKPLELFVCLVLLSCSTMLLYRKYDLRSASRISKLSPVDTEVSSNRNAERTIIVTAVNSDYTKMFENFLESIRRTAPHRLSSVFVIAEDTDAIRYMSKHHSTRLLNFPVGSKMDKFPANKTYKPPMTRSIRELYARRPERLLKLLEDTRANVLYMDADSAWVKDAFEFIAIENDTELAVIPDVKARYFYSVGKLNESLARNSCYNYCCSCFLYMKPTENVKSLLAAWSKSLYERPTYDQDALNLVLPKMQRLKWEILSPGHFPNGNFYFGSAYFGIGMISTATKIHTPAVVHANYMTGFKEKQHALQRVKMWFVD